MKTYKLLNKSKETINKVNRTSIGEAILYFSEVKKLTIDMLLSIYDVVEE